MLGKADGEDRVGVELDAFLGGMASIIFEEEIAVACADLARPGVADGKDRDVSGGFCGVLIPLSEAFMHGEEGVGLALFDEFGVAIATPPGAVKHGGGACCAGFIGEFANGRVG